MSQENQRLYCENNHSPINGVINIYKEKGFTSHDVVAKLRGILGQKKIGHTGTLDPDAEGVLPVCIGSATKLCDFIMEKKKEYLAVLILGIRTDTQDLSGKVLHTDQSYKQLTKEQIYKTVQEFVGETEQIPPMYSAIKVNGRKLYELARKGIEIERKPRKVTIDAIEIKKIALPEVQLSVRCSKGTYIRTLCEDIGEKLGTGGCMGSLLRTASGSFLTRDSIRLSQVEEWCRNDREELRKNVIPVDEILRDFGKAWVKKSFTALLDNGNPLKTEMFSKTEDTQVQDFLRVYDSECRFKAVYRRVAEDTYQPEKMFL